MKKAQKEPQRKKPRSWSFKSTRAGRRTAISPSQSSFAFSSGNCTRPIFSPSVGSTRNIGQFVYSPTQKRDTCFGCGNPGLWRNECLLLDVVAQAKPEGKKLSNHFIDLCDNESISESKNAFEHVSERDTLGPVEKRDFLERECRPDSVRGRLKRYVLKRPRAH